MSVSLETVAHVARLARLKTTPEQRSIWVGELNRVLELVDQLAQVPVEGVAPLFHPNDPSLRARPDQVTEHDQHLAFQAIAPATSADLYLVPKVIESA